MDRMDKVEKGTARDGRAYGVGWGRALPDSRLPVDELSPLGVDKQHRDGPLSVPGLGVSGARAGCGDAAGGVPQTGPSGSPPLAGVPGGQGALVGSSEGKGEGGGGGKADALSVGKEGAGDVEAALATCVAFGRMPGIVRESKLMDLLAVMEAHVDHSGVQEVACKSLFTLALHPDNCESIGAFGGIGAVLRGMKAHPGHGAVQEQGCRVLWNLAPHPINQGAMVDQGTLQVVMLAMMRHRDVARCQEQAMRVVNALLGAPQPTPQAAAAPPQAPCDMRALATQWGYVGHVTRAMEHHVGHTGCQEQGCRAVRLLLVGHGGGPAPAVPVAVRQAVMDGAGPGYVVRAMEHHPSHAGCQAQGGAALAALAALESVIGSSS